MRAPDRVLLHDGHGRLLGNRVDPPTMFSNEVNQSIDSFGFGNIEFHGLLADVEIYLAGSAANITEVCICHFAGAIYDATHDRNLYSF